MDEFILEMHDFELTIKNTLLNNSLFAHMN